MQLEAVAAGCLSSQHLGSLKGGLAHARRLLVRTQQGARQQAGQQAGAGWLQALLLYGCYKVCRILGGSRPGGSRRGAPPGQQDCQAGPQLAMQHVVAGLTCSRQGHSSMTHRLQEA